ncbi:MAG: beta strand repeat-containing protein, partial [Fusobacteriaceae bacterium]
MAKLINTSITGTLNVSGASTLKAVIATSFSGDGANVTNVGWANIVSKTSVLAGTGLSGGGSLDGDITISHLTTPGNIHLPAGGSLNQWLKWSSAGTGAWITPSNLVRGTYLTGNNYNGNSAETWAVDATPTNVASKVVARDSSGNFLAGMITANLTGAVTGNATTATRWQTARSFTIGNTSKSVDGTGNVSWTAVEIGATSEPGVGTSFGNYNQTSGILLRTSIPATSDTMVNGTITGNAYGGGETPRTDFNFYNYNTGGSITSVSAIAHGIVFPLSFFNLNGFVHIWFKQTSAYQSFQIVINTGNNTQPAGWEIISSNAVEPTTGVTRMVRVTPSKTWNSSTLQFGVGASNMATGNHTHIPSQVGLGNVNNWSASTSINSTSTTTYSTASAVKQAYDKGVEGLAMANTKLNATDNAVSASKLLTARSINGTNFNGEANITTANWGTARTLTVGNTGKSVNGGGNVTWSIAEIGAVPLTSPGSTSIITDSDSSSTTEFMELKSGGNSLRVVSSGGGATPVVANNKLTFNGNAVYNAGYKPNRADVGLPNVKDVSLNWAWGTATPTHIWGSQGDSVQSYVYNGSQLKTFVGLAAVNNWGASSAIDSTSQTTYATAAAVKIAYDKALEAINAGGANQSITITGSGSLSGGGDLTANRVITHLTTSGHKHIPSGGGTDQFLKYSGASGTAAWSVIPAASATVSGIVKVGANISVTAGTISIANYEPAFTKNNAFNKSFGLASGSVAEGNHTHTYIRSEDKRAVNDTPQLVATTPSVNFQFRANTTDGLVDGGTYHGVMTFRPYGSGTDFSGGGVHQLGFTESGNLYVRTSNGASAWNTWNKVLTSSNLDISTKADKTTTISVAGAALSGGGSLAANRTITHSDAAGYKHIPSGGTTDQFLKYSGTSGTAVWSSIPVGNDPTYVKKAGDTMTGVLTLKKPVQSTAITNTAANASLKFVKTDTGATVGTFFIPMTQISARHGQGYETHVTTGIIKAGYGTGWGEGVSG